MKVEVPYISQHLDIKDETWRARGCSVACLAMVLRFHKKEDLASVDDLLWEAFEIGGFESGWWQHDALVRVFHNHGLRAHKEEFKSIFPSFEKEFMSSGVEKIIAELGAGRPVMVSGYKKWDRANDFHTFVLVGLDEGKGGGVNGFYYHDPDAYSKEDGKELFIPKDLFLEKWRKLAIFVY